MLEAETSLLRELFGDYRSEWSQNQFETLFVPPTYLGTLEARRPAVLLGGRGTGKTTALRSLRFDAAHSRLGPSERLSYLGLYIRINANRVRAFRNSRIDEDTWGRCFAHYFNLLVALEYCRLCQWLATTEGWTPLTDSTAPALLTALGLGPSKEDAGAAIQNGLAELELYVNNVSGQARPTLSMAEAPLRTMTDLLSQKPEFGPRLLLCCIDEYENLLDYQQGILNTYVKHSEPPLSYKVGAKRFGIRNKETADKTDVLMYPDDFREIDVSSEPPEEYSEFAMAVVGRRLDSARARLGSSAAIPSTPDDLLPGLSRADEAKRLGAERAAAKVEVEAAATNWDPSVAEWVRALPAEDKYLLAYWAESAGRTTHDVAKEAFAKPSAWIDRVNNYGHASLYWLSKGHKGARIRKYYCGLNTFLRLSSGNIRYFLELIEQSLVLCAAPDVALVEGVGIPPDIQTEAARAVARQRLEQLEGLSRHGTELKRLVLVLGKVFFEFARSPLGHSPEQNSFVLSGSEEARREIEVLLREGVSHQAFEVSARTKATSDLELRDDEYRLHPILCPYFEFSYRRKRRVTFSADTLLEIGKSPRQAMTALLQGREQTPPDELPEQLALFSAFYDAATSGEE